MRRPGISLGSLWDLSSCWRVWDQKHNEEMWDLSRDLSGISLGTLLVLDPWACVPYIEFSLWSALGSLWDLSSCWCVRDQKHDEGMWDLCPFAADGSCVGNPSFFLTDGVGGYCITAIT